MMSSPTSILFYSTSWDTCIRRTTAVVACLFNISGYYVGLLPPLLYLFSSHCLCLVAPRLLSYPNLAYCVLEGRNVVLFVQVPDFLIPFQFFLSSLHFRPYEVVVLTITKVVSSVVGLTSSMFD